MGHLSDMRIHLIKNINILKLKQTYSKLLDIIYFLPQASTQVTGPAMRDGPLADPTAFLANTLNSYDSSWLSPDTMKPISMMFEKLAFTHLPLEASLLSTL